MTAMTQHTAFPIRFIPSAKKDGTMNFRSEVFVPGGLWQPPCEADQPRTDTVELRWLFGWSSVEKRFVDAIFSQHDGFEESHSIC